MSGLWITPDELPDDLGDSEFAQEACETASHILWAMSGRKFSGPATVTERYGKDLPDLDSLIIQLDYLVTQMDLIYGALPEWRDLLHNRLRLRGRPVTAVAEVIDLSTGLAVPSDTWFLENHATLVFDHYITTQLEVTYTYGGKIPASGKMAARALASQFALLWSGRENECSLPDRVVSVNRQNVSWVLLDNQDFISDLRTGVYQVDLFLKSVNPYGATQRAKVFSPDLPRGRRPTPLG